MTNLVLFFSVILSAHFAHAQQDEQPTTQTNSPLLIINLGNDILGLQQSDRYLTSNLGVGAVVTDMPQFIERIMSQSPNTLYAITLNQQMYTPEDIEATELVPDDRPYAGWLFVRLQSSDRTKNNLIISGIEVGVVGPAALAEELQDVVHEWTDSTPPQGWDNQLQNELGINIIHLRAHNWRWDSAKIDQEIVAHTGGSLGNVNTHAEVGGLYRIGINIPDDMAASFLGNSALGTSEINQKYSVYLFTAATGRYVLQDIFLDGNTFKDSHSVEKENLVGALKAGIVVGIKGLELGYAASVVTKQFEEQNGAAHNGVVFIRFKTKF
jgi:hypothetical protein